MSAKHQSKNAVHLVASKSNGEQVVNQFLPIQSFYEKSHPVLDDADYRKRLGIVRLRGAIYGAKGNLEQEFEVRFDSLGLCEREAVRFADAPALGECEPLLELSPQGSASSVTGQPPSV